MTNRPDGASLAITFLYYKDLEGALTFYQDVMGFPLVIDQGDLAKILRMADGAHIGLVDETKGMNNWQADKCVQVCIRVPDVDAWYGYIQDQAVEGLSQMFVNDAIGIRAFVFNDPEGYQVEIQSATREGV